jgi:hypothetical protein
MTDREKITMGECVSPMTADRCPVCIDKCEASVNNFKLLKVLRANVIDKSSKQ